MTPQELYNELKRSRYDHHPYSRSDYPGEGMEILEEVIDGYWKERYLLNNNDCTAYELMDRAQRLTFVSEEDIDWDSVEKLDNHENAVTLSARYPRFYVGEYKNCYAIVHWTLYPDGMFFMDEDGYGMEPNSESVVYGIIDSHAVVVIPFQASTLQHMQQLLQSLITSTQ